MTMNTSLTVLGALMAATLVGCSPPAPVARAAVNDKVYAVTPNAMKIQAGMVNAAVTEMKVMERVEEGSGRIDMPAKLTAKLVLKNTSKDQTMRLLGGKIGYYDLKGQPIKLEDNRTEPTLKVSTSYGNQPDRLDPGQESTHNLDAEFPAEALKGKKLKDIRLELSFIPSQFREETLSFPVSIGGQ
jgi:hypothetical protein